VSNTVDSTWAFPRQLPQHGWQEMNYLGYQTQVGATLPEPINRDQNKGEFRLFLDSVVGANLYGVMPQDIESYLTKRITTQQGYPQNWISVNANTPEAYQQQQKQRQSLLRQFTARNDYKNDQHIIHAPLLYPQKSSALAAAAGYRQVVVTQSFTRGKDVFSQTPHTFKAMRLPQQQPTTISGHPYAFGEIITERSVEQGNPASQMHLVGNSMTEIDPNRPFEQGGNYLPNYTPFIRDISTKSSPQ
jgi:hypothetical protein